MKRKIDIIGKEIEIYKVKLILFMGISGGSWVYMLKFENLALRFLPGVTFAMASFGIFSNVLKLSDIENKLKEF